ncbi:MAG: AAA family ATPase [Polyangiaceae bacterium]
MLKRFSAKQYRNVEADGLEFRRVTLLVGPNNGGKSNLIDALRFHADIHREQEKGSAFHALIERRKYGDVLRRSVTPPGTVELKWEYEHGPYRRTTFDIAMRIARSESFPAGFFVSRDILRVVDPSSDRLLEFRVDETNPQEVIWQKRDTAGGPVVQKKKPFTPDDFVYGQIRFGPEPEAQDTSSNGGYPRLGEPKWFAGDIERQTFRSGSQLSPSQIAASAKRNLSILSLDETGSELVNVLNNLERRHNDFLDPFTERLREMLSGLERMRIDDVSDQYKSLKLKIDGQWFRLDELSEGTLKMLALGLLFFTPEKASLLSIDEPELNLHPAWLRVLGKWAFGATGADQVILSTHSPDLLDAFTEGFRNGDVALIVCDAKKGFRNIDPSALDSFFKEGWDLGDLYRVGEPALGGWPW